MVNYSPDGDSVRFMPRTKALVTSLANGASARFNGRGHVQLRLEAIDSLETHFSPPGGGAGALHQPLPLAHAAVDQLLAYLTERRYARVDSRALGGAERAAGGLHVQGAATERGRDGGHRW